MRTATRESLNESIEIRLIAAPAFVATKLEAFASRGKGDYMASHDLEDVLVVIDGRPGLTDEVRAASEELGEFIRNHFRYLLRDSNFENALPALIADSNRTEILLSRMRDMAA